MRVLVRYSSNEFYYGNITGIIELASLLDTRTWKLSIAFTDGRQEDSYFPDSNGDVHVIFDSLNDKDKSGQRRHTFQKREQPRIVNLTNLVCDFGCCSRTFLQLISSLHFQVQACRAENQRVGSKSPNKRRRSKTGSDSEDSDDSISRKRNTQTGL